MLTDTTARLTDTIETGHTGPLAYGIAPPAYRLPDATRVGAVHLLVSDLSRSRAFYQYVLGLRPIAVDADQVTYAAHGDDAPLVTLRSRRGVAPARRGAFGLYHFALLLPSRAALGAFASHLAALGVRVGMADHLVSEALYLSDPDGLGIEVYADRARREWRHHDGQLAMATDRLDIAGLIGAAGDEVWAGAPAGTTVGHVHLHVASLDGAEAFYHRALGLDKTVWDYPGALFLAAGGYHHHLGLNTWAPGPAPSADQARLLAWELVVPSRDDVAAVTRSLHAGGHTPSSVAGGVRADDPWGTQVTVRVEP